jgi:hypothetical protein
MRDDYVATGLDRSYRALALMREPQDEPMDFSAAHIAILGCGGLGANVALFLQRSGFRRFTLIDGDVVESSNMNRQFPLAPEQLGQNKTDALRDRLAAYGDELEIDTVQRWIHSAGDLEEVFATSTPDILVSGIDTPPGRCELEVATFSAARAIPTIFGGVTYRQVVVGPLLIGAPAFEAFIAEQRRVLDRLDENATRPILGSLPSTNSLTAAFVANEIVAYTYLATRARTVNTRLVFNPFDFVLQDEIKYA